VTAGATWAGARASAEHAALPVLALDGRQLGDLELLLSGAFAPLSGFLSNADLRAVAATATLADGTAWPIPVTLEVPADSVPDDADQILLADPEATPLAMLTITERAALDDGLVRLAGPVAGHRKPEHGSFRRLMLTPEQARVELDDGPVLAFATRAPLGSMRIGQLRHLAGQLGARVLLLPLVAGTAEVIHRPEPLIRAVLAAATQLPGNPMVIPIPLASRETDSGPIGDPAIREAAAAAIVAAAHGATALMSHSWPDGTQPGADSPAAAIMRAAPIPVLPPGEWAYDPAADVWRPLALIEAGTEIEDLSADHVADMLDTGAEIPSWYAPDVVIAELRHARPPRSERGLVLFLTGLSGSGKSTIARDLRDLLAERGDRRVSLLDGDLVRSLLSAGLTFSRADRDLNIARIGYVAAEIAKHGGIAICAPIAPFAAARERVRQMVSEVGDFLLIYVATPLEVCEARDRKGLYAKARAGLIGQFTGISDPYEEPTDAVLSIDTSVLDREQATQTIMAMLTAGSWLPA
jgi:sulfate adenylyltransferase